MKLFFTLIILPIIGHTTTPLSFSNGLKSYQEGRYQQANIYFLETLKESPHNSTVLYNLGLTEFQIGNQGKALGYLRRAQYFAPQSAEIKSALGFINPSQNKTLTITNILRKIPLDILIGFFTLGLFLTIYKGLIYLSRRKSSSFPTSLLILFCYTFILSLTVGYKIKDQYTPRATITVPKTGAHSGPSENQASLFEINEGVEVLVHKKLHSWLQITAPSGRTGWIHENTALISWGELL